MKKNKQILHSLSRSASLLMLCLVWFTSIFAKPTPIVHHVKNAEKHKTEKHDKQQTTVSELSLAVVVPSQAFSFEASDLLIPTPQIFFVFIEKIAPKIEKIFFLISYFENTFEHHIAINAP